MITQQYNLNLIPNSAILLVKCSQFDKTLRTLTFDLFEGSTAFQIPSGTTATISGTKPDKTGFSYEMTVGTSSVTIDVTEQMTAVAGPVVCEITLADGSGQISTANFVLQVEPSALAGTEISETEIPILQEAIEAAETVVSLSETFGSPLVAQTAAEMTLTNRVYVYTGSESGYTAGNWYYYNGSAWVSGGVYQSAAVAVDSALSTTSQNPVQNKVITEELTSLKSAVETIATFVSSKNLLDLSDWEEAYVNQTNGAIISNTASRVTKPLPIGDYTDLCFSAGANTNNMGSIRYAFYTENNTFVSGSGGIITVGSSPDETTGRYYKVLSVPSTAKYIRISAGKTSVWDATTLQLEEGTAPTEYYPYGYNSTTINLDVLPETVLNATVPKKYKSAFASGNLSDGGYIIVNEKASIKKAEIVSFVGNITTFSKLFIGFSSSTPTSQKAPYVEINNTQIKVAGANATGDTIISFTHGLTIENNIEVKFKVNPSTLSVELISNGEKYECTAECWKGNSLVSPFAYSEGSELTNCTLSWCACDIDKKIWMFGDSYYGITNTARWMYWLQQSGYADNALVDSYAGRASNNAIISLNTLLKFGKPDYIVWSMGMNDGSDGNTPTNAWMTGINTLLSVCEKYNIIPIFCTIPNVPSINHTQKNAWVKASGYRYIDFANAVGATEAGSTWYSGMLASDNVHPTEKGALALYGQAVTDFPEITID